MNDAPKWREALKAAGGADALAASLGIARRTLFKWRADGVPADRLHDFAQATGIAPAELRPDLARVFERGAA